MKKLIQTGTMTRFFVLTRDRIILLTRGSTTKPLTLDKK